MLGDTRYGIMYCAGGLCAVEGRSTCGNRLRFVGRVVTGVGARERRAPSVLLSVGGWQPTLTSMRKIQRGKDHSNPSRMGGVLLGGWAMRLALVVMLLAAAVSAMGGQNPAAEIFLEFAGGGNTIYPTPGTTFTVTVYLSNVDAGVTATEFVLQKSFTGNFVSATPLLESGMLFGSPDEGMAVAGLCTMPDGSGRVAVVQLLYFFISGPGTLEFLPYGGTSRAVGDCSYDTDQWCVRLEPSGHGGVGMDPPPGDCPATGVNVSPSSLAFELVRGARDSVVVTITNPGEDDVDWSVVEGAYSARHSGGPDDFGYVWEDSDEPGGPAFAWEDVGEPANQLPFTGDVHCVEVPLPWPFPFYGTERNSVWVGEKGCLSFEPISGQELPACIPTAAAPNSIIAALWFDVYASVNLKVYAFHDTSVPERFIIQYDYAYLWDVAYFDFEVILERDGSILLQYGTIFTGGPPIPISWDHCIGIENDDGSEGLGIRCINDPYLHEDLAILMEPYAWVDEHPLSGVAAAGASDDFTVVADASEMESGTYSCDLVLSTSDPGVPEIRVPVTLTVTTPDISITPSSLDFELAEGFVDSQTLTIGNSGDGGLEWWITESDASREDGDLPGVGSFARLWPDRGGRPVEWVSEEPSSGAIPVGGPSVDVTVTVNSAGLPPGFHECDLVVGSNDFDEAERHVPVSLFVVDLTDPHPHRWDVPSEVPTIQDGMDIAAPGDTVYVAPGIYSVSLGESLPIALTDDVLLLSAGGPDSTVIDGEDQHVILACGTWADVAVDGFTLTRAATGPFQYDVFRLESGDAAFTDCIISSSVVGLVATDDSRLLVSDCTFRDDEYGISYFGSAGFGGGGGFASVDIEDCLFEGQTECVAVDMEPGSYPPCCMLSVSISRCVFRGNFGGLYFTDGSIDHGMQCLASSETVSDCVFEGNAGSAISADILAYGPTLSITGCTFVGNMPFLSETTLLRIMHPMNEELYDRLEISNCLIAFNEHDELMSSSGLVELTCCDVFGNTNGDWSGLLEGQYGDNGNICADPRFCDAEHGDYHVSDGDCSPCSPLNSPEGCGLMGALGIGCDPRPFAYSVSPDGLGDFPTIESAIAASCPGDTILLAPGRYSSSTSGEVLPIVLVGGAVHLVGTSGASSTVLDAEGAGRVLEVHGVSAPRVIENLRLTGGASEEGGAIFIEDSAIDMVGCVIDSSSAVTGGGMHALGSTVSMLQCFVENNSASVGGGIYADDSTTNLDECVLASNAATTSGAMFCVGSTSSLSHCTLYGNDAVDGSALRCVSEASSFLENCIVAANTGSPPVSCQSGSEATASCCDVFGNPWGDWVDGLAGQGDEDGNFSADPLFCDGAAGDFSVSVLSPCAGLGASGCGQVGAIEAGCGGAVWHVPGDATTIQGGIDLASAGDIVMVDPGTYSTSTNGESFPIHMKSGLALVGAGGRSATIVDAEQQATVFSCFDADTTTVLSNMRIRGGHAAFGGGVYCEGSGLRVCECDFVENEATSRGGAVHCDSSSVFFRNCSFADNHAGSLGGGAIYYCNAAELSFARCSFSGNSSNNYGGALCGRTSPGAATLNECILAYNSANTRGGAVDTDGGDVTLAGCIVTGNAAVSAGGGGGAVWCAGADLALSTCVFSGNVSPDRGGAIGIDETTLHVDGCTFYGNAAPEGSMLWSGGADDATLENTIVSYGTGGDAVTCYAGGTALLTCCDVYGNGGDWTGCIAGQDAMSGNFSLDPRFTDPESGDLHLLPDSPCLSAGGCGLVGALGHSLGDRPLITGVLDVGNDQGRSVRVWWFGSTYDAPGDSVDVTGYAVYRRQDAWLRRGNTARGHALRTPEASDLLRLDGWDYLATVPAAAETVYQYVAPTLCDSTAAGGICWSVFFTRALTTDPLIHFDSEPDSGYSVDNLCPEAPHGLLADGDETLVVLSWDPNQEEDLDYYAVYRDAVENFAPATPIGYTITESFEDADPPDAPEWWYRVTAWDFNGNESEPSEPAGVVATAVPEALPTTFWLGPAVPNPFNATTEIHYWVPSEPRGCRVELVIHDASGRRVCTLVDCEVPPGVHAAAWNGRDDRGAAVASGVYFYSMQAGDYSSKRKMVLLK
jgi:hypothetical protein